MHIFLYVVLAMAKGYVPDFKLGTLIARVMPFVPVFGLVWIGVLAIFYFGDLPPGPGQFIHMP
jgi:aminobenzoyl-glutamate transport protein